MMAASRGEHFACNLSVGKVDGKAISLGGEEVFKGGQNCSLSPLSKAGMSP